MPGDYPITKNEFSFVESLMPFTAFDELEMIGFFTLRNPNESLDELRFGFVIVNPDKRGTGCGKAMIQLGLKFVFEIYGAKRASLGVFENNLNAYEENVALRSDWKLIIFVPDGMKKPLKSIIEQPELQLYVADFGKADDWCLVAEIKEKIVGAVWVRIMNDYGHIDNETPSFAISLYEEYRHLGIGTALMKAMLQLLKEKGYKQASLSVQKANYAVDMYRKVGFEVVDENEEEYIMVCPL